MGGSTSKSTQTTTPPEEVMAGFRNVNAMATNAANTPFKQYSTNPNDFVAPMNATQNYGVAGTNQYAGAAQPYYGAATGQLMNAQDQATPFYGAAAQSISGAQGAGQAANEQAYSTLQGAYQGAQPFQQAATQYAQAGAQAVDPSALGGQQINQYMSPYLHSVVGNTAALLNQQNQQAMAGQTGNAIRQGAFGGDRAGIASAVLQGQQNLASGNVLSGLLNQGYGQALQTAQQQQGLGLSAAQANRAAQQQAAGQMLGIGQQGFGQGTATAEQIAALGQQQFGQGMTTAQQQQALGQGIYGMGAATSQGLAGLGAGAQSAGLQGAEAQLAAGQVGQQTEQAGKTALFNQFQQQQSYPFQTAQFLANTLEGTGALSGSTTTATSKKPLLASGGVVPSSHGGPVSFWHSGEGYADGGSPQGYSPPGFDPQMMAQILQNAQGMYGPYLSALGGGEASSGTGPYGGKGFVPAANLPVSHPQKVELSYAPDSGTSTAGDAARTAESYDEFAKSKLGQKVTGLGERGYNYVKNKITGQPEGAARGGVIGYAFGGPPSSPYGSNPGANPLGTNMDAAMAAPVAGGALEGQQALSIPTGTPGGGPNKGLAPPDAAPGASGSQTEQMGRDVTSMAHAATAVNDAWKNRASGGVVGYGPGGPVNNPYGSNPGTNPLGTNMDAATGNFSAGVVPEKPQGLTIPTGETSQGGKSPSSPPAPAGSSGSQVEQIGKDIGAAATAATAVAAAVPAVMALFAKGGSVGSRRGYALDGAVEDAPPEYPGQLPVVITEDQKAQYAKALGAAPPAQPPSDMVFKSPPHYNPKPPPVQNIQPQGGVAPAQIAAPASTPAPSPANPYHITPPLGSAQSLVHLPAAGQAAARPQNALEDYAMRSVLGVLGPAALGPAPRTGVAGGARHKPQTLPLRTHPTAMAQPGDEAADADVGVLDSVNGPTFSQAGVAPPEENAVDADVDLAKIAAAGSTSSPAPSPAAHKGLLGGLGGILAHPLQARSDYEAAHAKGTPQDNYMSRLLRGDPQALIPTATFINALVNSRGASPLASLAYAAKTGAQSSQNVVQQQQEIAKSNQDIISAGVKNANDIWMGLNRGIIKKDPNGLVKDAYGNSYSPTNMPTGTQGAGQAASPTHKYLTPSILATVEPAAEQYRANAVGLGAINPQRVADSEKIINDVYSSGAEANSNMSLSAEQANALFSTPEGKQNLVQGPLGVIFMPQITIVNDILKKIGLPTISGVGDVQIAEKVRMANAAGQLTKAQLHAVDALHGFQELSPGQNLDRHAQAMLLAQNNIANVKDILRRNVLDEAGTIEPNFLAQSVIKAFDQYYDQKFFNDMKNAAAEIYESKNSPNVLHGLSSPRDSDEYANTINYINNFGKKRGVANLSLAFVGQ